MESEILDNPGRKLVVVLAHPRQPRYTNERWQRCWHTLIDGDMRMRCGCAAGTPLSTAIWEQEVVALLVHLVDGDMGMRGGGAAGTPSSMAIREGEVVAAISMTLVQYAPTLA